MTVPLARHNGGVSDRDAAVDRLQAVPLEDFVAERTRLAKELRKGGDRPAAAELAKLPKPTPPAWALNHFAREQPEAMGAWLDVAAALRDESAAPGSGLREAMAAHRDATVQLVKAVRDLARPNGRALSEPMVERVRALLQIALTDAEQAERLRAGRITEGDAAGAELPEPEPEAKGRAAERRAEREQAESEREAEREAERRAALMQRVEEARDAHERLAAEAEERQGASAEAAERLEEAQRTLHRRESEAAAAEEAARDAVQAAEDAERELETLTAQLRRAGGS